MYRIIKTDGTEVGVCEEPLYIKRGKSGCFVPTTAEEATGVAHRSVAYSLFGHDEIGGDTVLLNKYDGGNIAAQEAQNAANIDYLSMMTGVDLPNTEEVTVNG